MISGVAKRAVGIGAAAIAASVLLASGCERETRVIRYNPPLGAVPGSESGEKVVRDWGEYHDPTKVQDNKIVVDNPDGTVTLVAKTGRHVMVHVFNTLVKDQRELFTEQVLSQRTKDEYAARGLDPAQAFDDLKARFTDIQDLFNAMPMGEYTPGVFMQNAGRGVKRIEVTGLAASDLRFVGMDVVMEDGNMRLRWFVPAR